MHASGAEQYGTQVVDVKKVVMGLIPDGEIAVIDGLLGFPEPGVVQQADMVVVEQDAAGIKVPTGQ